MAGNRDNREALLRGISDAGGGQVDKRRSGHNLRRGVIAIRIHRPAGIRAGGSCDAPAHGSVGLSTAGYCGAKGLRGAKLHTGGTCGDGNCDVAGNRDAGGRGFGGIRMARCGDLHGSARRKAGRRHIDSIGGNRSGLNRTACDSVHTPDNRCVRRARNARGKIQCFTQQHSSRLRRHRYGDGGRWWRRGRY